MGTKVFTGLAGGSYNVTESSQTGWTQNNTTCGTITLAASANATATCTVTNTKNPVGKSAILGFKFEDRDGDGKITDDLNHRLNGWTIYIDSNNNGMLDSGEPTAVTSGSGALTGLYSFNNLFAGTYVLREVLQPGWIATYPAGGKYTVTLANNQSISLRNFGNFQTRLHLGYEV